MGQKRVIDIHNETLVYVLIYDNQSQHKSWGITSVKMRISSNMVYYYITVVESTKYRESMVTFVRVHVFSFTRILEYFCTFSQSNRSK